MDTRKHPRRRRWRMLLLPAGIRQRLFLLITLVLLPSLLMLGWIYYQRYELRRDEALQTELEVAQGIAAVFTAHVEDVRRMSYAIGQAMITFAPAPREKATRLLTRAAAEYPTVRAVNWVNRQGLVVASSDPRLIGRSIASRPYFHEIQGGKPWAVGNLTPDAILEQNRPTFAIATAIRDDAGSLLGVVVAGMEPTHLQGLTLLEQRPAGGDYILFDRAGVVVFRSPDLAERWEARVRWRESDRMLRQALATGEAQAGSVRLEVPGGEWLAARVPIPDYGWVAGAGRPRAIALAPVWKNLLKEASLAILIASFAFLGAYFLARTIAAPLRRLERDAQAMGAGRIEAADDPQAPLEVRHLRQTVADMATDLLHQADGMRRSEARFRAIFNGISDAAIFADTERRIRMINPAFTRIFGYSVEEALGQTTEFLYADHAEYRRLGEERFNLRPPGDRAGDSSSIEIRFRRKEGMVFWAESLAMRILDPAGEVIGFLALVRDISERRGAEEALRESEERLRLFIEHAPAALAMLDRQMRYIAASRRWRSDFGLGDREIHGLSHYEVFPEIPDPWKEIHRRGLAGEVLRADEERFERADGTVQWLRWEVRPWRDAAGAVGGILIFSEEITERKRTEEALRANEERLRQGVRVAHIGVFEHDHLSNIIHLSPEMQEISDFAASEMGFEDLGAWVHPDDRERTFAAIRRAHDPAGDGIYSIEHRMMRRDGTVRQVSVRARTFFTGEGAARRPLRTIGAAIDVTERMRMEEDLRAAKEAAEGANRVKSEFLANMSHELRTPLTIIMTSLEMLRDPDLSGADTTSFLDMADGAAQHLLEIIDDLLDITRIESRQLRIEESTFDLRQCIRQATNTAVREARQKGLVFRLDMAPALPQQVTGDPLRLRQVLGNLAGNAVKFTARGEVTVSVQAGAEGIIFAVRDTGAGIPAEKLALLFRPFTQIDSSLTRRHGGTGLGLAISKKLVEQMGGRIEVESTAAGSLFTVTLPLRPAAGTTAAVAAPGRPMRVLVAEDDAMIRNLLETILRRRGLEVVLAENGRQALQRWQEGGIDLVLMDLQMPEMDGLAAARAIRASEEEGGSHTPILALTAHAHPQDREQSLAAGMDGFLSKPISMEELYAKVESCLYGGCETARKPT